MPGLQVGAPRVAGGGFVQDSAGVFVPVRRSFAYSVAALLVNPVLPAQGVGRRIRVLSWQVQYNSFVVVYSGFFSGATQLSAFLPFNGTVTYQWQTFTEHGHFETPPNAPLEFVFTPFAGAPFGLNLTWIVTP
jgi:hypothetical protein